MRYFPSNLFFSLEQRLIFKDPPKKPKKGAEKQDKQVEKLKKPEEFKPVEILDYYEKLKKQVPEDKKQLGALLQEIADKAQLKWVDVVNKIANTRSSKLSAQKKKEMIASYLEAKLEATKEPRKQLELAKIDTVNHIVLTLIEIKLGDIAPENPVTPESEKALNALAFMTQRSFIHSIEDGDIAPEKFVETFGDFNKLKSLKKKDLKGLSELEGMAFQKVLEIAKSSPDRSKKGKYPIDWFQETITVGDKKTNRWNTHVITPVSVAYNLLKSPAKKDPSSLIERAKKAGETTKAGLEDAKKKATEALTWASAGQALKVAGKAALSFVKKNPLAAVGIAFALYRLWNRATRKKKSFFDNVYDTVGLVSGLWGGFKLYGHIEGLRAAAKLAGKNLDKKEIDAARKQAEKLRQQLQQPGGARKAAEDAARNVLARPEAEKKKTELSEKVKTHIGWIKRHLKGKSQGAVGFGDEMGHDLNEGAAEFEKFVENMDQNLSDEEKEKLNSLKDEPEKIAIFFQEKYATHLKKEGKSENELIEQFRKQMHLAMQNPEEGGREAARAIANAIIYGLPQRFYEGVSSLPKRSFIKHLKRRMATEKNADEKEKLRKLIEKIEGTNPNEEYGWSDVWDTTIIAASLGFEVIFKGPVMYMVDPDGAMTKIAFKLGYTEKDLADAKRKKEITAGAEKVFRAILLTRKANYVVKIWGATIAIIGATAEKTTTLGIKTLSLGRELLSPVKLSKKGFEAFWRNIESAGLRANARRHQAIAFFRGKESYAKFSQNLFAQFQTYNKYAEKVFSKLTIKAGTNLEVLARNHKLGMEIMKHKQNVAAMIAAGENPTDEILKMKQKLKRFEEEMMKIKRLSATQRKATQVAADLGSDAAKMRLAVDDIAEVQRKFAAETNQSRLAMQELHKTGKLPKGGVNIGIYREMGQTTCRSLDNIARVQGGGSLKHLGRGLEGGFRTVKEFGRTTMKSGATLIFVGISLREAAIEGSQKGTKHGLAKFLDISSHLLPVIGTARLIFPDGIMYVHVGKDGEMRIFTEEWEKRTEATAIIRQYTEDPFKCATAGVGLGMTAAATWRLAWIGKKEFVKELLTGRALEAWEFTKGTLRTVRIFAVESLGEFGKAAAKSPLGRAAGRTRIGKWLADGFQNLQYGVARRMGGEEAVRELSRNMDDILETATGGATKPSTAGAPGAEAATTRRATDAAADAVHERMARQGVAATETLERLAANADEADILARANELSPKLREKVKSLFKGRLAAAAEALNDAAQATQGLHPKRADQIFERMAAAETAEEFGKVAKSGRAWRGFKAAGFTALGGFSFFMAYNSWRTRNQIDNMVKIAETKEYRVLLEEIAKTEKSMATLNLVLGIYDLGYGLSEFAFMRQAGSAAGREFTQQLVQKGTRAAIRRGLLKASEKFFSVGFGTMIFAEAALQSGHIAKRNLDAGLRERTRTAADWAQEFTEAELFAQLNRLSYDSASFLSEISTFTDDYGSTIVTGGLNISAKYKEMQKRYKTRGETNKNVLLDIRDQIIQSTILKRYGTAPEGHLLARRIYDLSGKEKIEAMNAYAYIRAFWESNKLRPKSAEEIRRIFKEAWKFAAMRTSRLSFPEGFPISDEGKKLSAKDLEAARSLVAEQSYDQLKKNRVSKAKSTKDLISSIESSTTSKAKLQTIYLAHYARLYPQEVEKIALIKDNLTFITESIAQINKDILTHKMRGPAALERALKKNEKNIRTLHEVIRELYREFFEDAQATEDMTLEEIANELEFFAGHGLKELFKQGQERIKAFEAKQRGKTIAEMQKELKSGILPGEKEKLKNAEALQPIIARLQADDVPLVEIEGIMSTIVARQAAINNETMSHALNQLLFLRREMYNDETPISTQAGTSVNLATKWIDYYIYGRGESPAIIKNKSSSQSMFEFAALLLRRREGFIADPEEDQALLMRVFSEQNSNLYGFYHSEGSWYSQIVRGLDRAVANVHQLRYYMSNYKESMIHRTAEKPLEIWRSDVLRKQTAKEIQSILDILKKQSVERKYESFSKLVGPGINFASKRNKQWVHDLLVEALTNIDNDNQIKDKDAAKARFLAGAKIILLKHSKWKKITIPTFKTDPTTIITTEKLDRIAAEFHDLVSEFRTIKDVGVLKKTEGLPLEIVENGKYAYSSSEHRVYPILKDTESSSARKYIMHRGKKRYLEIYNEGKTARVEFPKYYVDIEMSKKEEGIRASVIDYARVVLPGFGKKATVRGGKYKHELLDIHISRHYPKNAGLSTLIRHGVGFLKIEKPDQGKPYISGLGNLAHAVHISGNGEVLRIQANGDIVKERLNVTSAGEVKLSGGGVRHVENTRDWKKLPLSGEQRQWLKTTLERLEHMNKIQRASKKIEEYLKIKEYIDKHQKIKSHWLKLPGTGMVTVNEKGKIYRRNFTDLKSKVYANDVKRTQDYPNYKLEYFEGKISQTRAGDPVFEWKKLTRVPSDIKYREMNKPTIKDMEMLLGCYSFKVESEGTYSSYLNKGIGALNYFGADIGKFRKYTYTFHRRELSKKFMNSWRKSLASKKGGADFNHTYKFLEDLKGKAVTEESMIDW